LSDRNRIEKLKRRLSTLEARIDVLESQLAERSRVEEGIEDLPDKIRTEGTYKKRRQWMLDQAFPIQ